MRTNVVIDDQLMEQAMRASGCKTKRETIEAALTLLTRQQTASALLGSLRGKVDWDPDYDYKAMRKDKGEQAQ